MYYLIRIVHFILILLCILSIGIPNYNIKKYSLMFLIFLLFHYITNFGKCGLTELEFLLSNKQYEEGFMYNIIKPIISISEIYFNSYLYIFHILWIIILFNQLK